MVDYKFDVDFVDEEVVVFKGKQTFHDTVSFLGLGPSYDHMDLEPPCIQVELNVDSKQDPQVWNDIWQPLPSPLPKPPKYWTQNYE